MQGHQHETQNSPQSSPHEHRPVTCGCICVGRATHFISLRISEVPERERESGNYTHRLTIPSVDRCRAAAAVAAVDTQ